MSDSLPLNLWLHFLFIAGIPLRLFMEGRHGAQSGYLFHDSFDGVVYLFLGVEPAKTKTDGAVCQILFHSQGPEHMGRLQAGRCAG